MSALRSDPRAAGAGARIGIGLCAYQLGDTEKALIAIERAHALAPNSVPALVATAFLRLECASQHDGGRCDDGPLTSSVGRMLGHARELNPTYSMALNHYANHLFWQNSGEIVGHAQPGSSRILLRSDPAYMLKAGTQIEIFDAKDKKMLETQVNQVHATSDTTHGWVTRLETPYPLTTTNRGVQRILIRIAGMTEISELASRAYHCSVYSVNASTRRHR